MDIHRLIKMANDIGSFFEAEPDQTKAAEGIADHLKKFWDPRMRYQISSYVNEQGGTDLKPIVLRALRQGDRKNSVA